MWKTICAANGPYLFDYQRLENTKTFIFFLTNLNSFWIKEIPEEFLVKAFQEYNPTLDIKVEDTIKEILSLLNNVDKEEVNIKEKDETVTMKLEHIVPLPHSSLKVAFNIELQKDDQKKFTEMVTIPMIQTIYFLEKQREMLSNLIRKKDLELEQYRLEKELISRTDLITEKFDENVLTTTSEKLVLNVFGNADKFMGMVSQKYGEIEEKVESVSVEPWNQVKKKRKIFNANTATKKNKKGIIYTS